MKHKISISLILLAGGISVALANNQQTPGTPVDPNAIPQLKSISTTLGSRISATIPDQIGIDGQTVDPSFSWTCQDANGKCPPILHEVARNTDTPKYEFIDLKKYPEIVFNVQGVESPKAVTSGQFSIDFNKAVSLDGKKVSQTATNYVVNILGDSYAVNDDTVKQYCKDSQYFTDSFYLKANPQNQAQGNLYFCIQTPTNMNVNWS